jgi:serine/threonine protein phosphatase PrpC
VREKRDYLGFWNRTTKLRRRQRRAVAVVADGVSSLQNGDIASKMAIEIAIVNSGEPVRTAVNYIPAKV